MKIHRVFSYIENVLVCSLQFNNLKEVELMYNKIVFCYLMSIWLLSSLLKAVPVFAYCHPQCLEYVQAETNIGGPYGDANGAWTNALGNNNWRSVAKGSVENPSVGDVLYFDIGSYGHVAMIRSVDVVNNSVEIDDRNMDGNCGLRENVEIDLANNGVVGWLTTSSPTTPVQHHKISVLDTRWWSQTKNQTLSISWYPANVPCNKATSWHKNETCSADYGNKDACQKFYSELTSIDYVKYAFNLEWKTVFFGNTDDYRNLCGY